MELQKIISKLFDKRGVAFITVGLIMGILLIVLSPNSSQKSEDKNANAVSASEKFDILEYTNQMENRIKQIVSAIDGIEDVSVMLYFGDDGEIVYAMEETVNSGGTESQSANYFVYSGAEGEHPLYIKRKYPKVSGVMIVCSGECNEKRKARIIQSVSSLLGVSSARVEVILSK